MPASPVDDLPRPYAVAIHDAGSANIIIEWCTVAAQPPVGVWAEGPAKALWVARFGPALLVEGPDGLLAGARALLSGTGWASGLEHRARIEAAAKGIVSVAVIDHWVNYRARFVREGFEQVPDCIWVGDEHALRLARESFPGTPVECHPNRYFNLQVAAAGRVPESGDILFVAEPARSTWGASEQGEFQALDFFMAARSRAGIPLDRPIRLRPHPSDPLGKYDTWLAANPGVALDQGGDLSAALRHARWVAGMNSMALAIAAGAGRETVSALPPNAPPCSLPHPEIRRL